MFTGCGLLIVMSYEFINVGFALSQLKIVFLKPKKFLVSCISTS